MINYLIEKIISFIVVLRLIWRSFRHPKEYIHYLKGLPLKERRGEVVKVVIGSTATFVVTGEALTSLYDIGIKIKPSDLHMFFIWSGLALFLHAGIVAAKIKGNSYAWTLELFGLSFSSFFIYSAVFLVFLTAGLSFLGGVSNQFECIGDTTAECMQNYFNKIIEKDFDIELYSLIFLLMRSLIYFAMPIIILLSSINLVVAIKNGYQTHLVRSYAAVTIGALLSCLFILAVACCRYPTQARDLLVVSGFHIATKQEQEVLLNLRLVYIEENLADAAPIACNIAKTITEQNDLKSSEKYGKNISDEFLSKFAKRLTVPASQECIEEYNKESLKFRNRVEVEFRKLQYDPMQAGWMEIYLNSVLVFLGADTSPGRESLKEEFSNYLLASVIVNE